MQCGSAYCIFNKYLITTQKTPILSHSVPIYYLSGGVDLFVRDARLMAVWESFSVIKKLPKYPTGGVDKLARRAAEAAGKR